jgi:hypothetical protein
MNTISEPNIRRKFMVDSAIGRKQKTAECVNYGEAQLLLRFGDLAYNAVNSVTRTRAHEQILCVPV